MRVEAEESVRLGEMGEMGSSSFMLGEYVTEVTCIYSLEDRSVIEINHGYSPHRLSIQPCIGRRLC